MRPLLATGYDGALQGYAWGLLLIVSIIIALIALFLALFPRSAHSAYKLSKISVWAMCGLLLLFLLLVQAGYHDLLWFFVSSIAPGIIGFVAFLISGWHLKRRKL